MNAADGKYELVLTRRFVKDLKKLDRQDQVRVRRALDRIKDDPWKGGRVTGAKVGQYRWRVGSLRIRYDILGQEIQVLRVTKREDAYRK
jgi:mRNA interferase RelE/StbE